MRQRGFTLPELVATVAIAAVLAAVAMPAFREVIRDNRLTAQTTNLTSALYFARTEAISRGTRVTLCKSVDMKQCNTDAATGYEKGWIVFTDLSNDATVNPEAGDRILRVFQGSSQGTTVAAATTLKNYISYTPAGVSRLVGPGAAFQAGSLVICQYGKSRKITVSAAGRVSTAAMDGCPAP